MDTWFGMRLDNAETKPFIMKYYDQISRLLISVIPELAEHKPARKKEALQENILVATVARQIALELTNANI